jgi:hypothetical protein
VICRLWHGWTCASDADAYETYLRDDLYPRLERDLAGKGYRATTSSDAPSARKSSS